MNHPLDFESIWVHYEAHRLFKPLDRGSLRRRNCLRVDFRRGAEARVAQLSLRRFQWFAHGAQQRRMRSTEIMPTETSEFRFRASREQPALLQISGSQISSDATGEDE